MSITSKLIPPDLSQYSDAKMEIENEAGFANLQPHGDVKRAPQHRRVCRQLCEEAINPRPEALINAKS